MNEFLISQDVLENSCAECEICRIEHKKEELNELDFKGSRTFICLNCEDKEKLR